MIPKKVYSIFKNGSVTYFYSSLFFPTEIRQDVFTLYSFVRVADNFVDQIPPQKEEFFDFTHQYRQTLKNKFVNNPIISSFVSLQKKTGIQTEWVTSFLATMQQDLTKKNYADELELADYMYGSAEVVGLMMSRILKLPPESEKYAQVLGKSMQYINFLRDVQEDISLGRTYIPQTILKKYQLSALNQQTVLTNQTSFNTLVRTEIKKYREWMKQAQAGFQYIPIRYLIPIKTASDMYDWTAQQIEKDPMIVFRKKVKPTPLFVIATVIKNAIQLSIFYPFLRNK